MLEEFGLRGPAVDLAEDLLGPNVKFHHSKLNFKWACGGEEVKWHQDIQFWPHSNYSPLTIGVYMADVDDEMGPMGVIPGSHNEELFDLYGDDGQWVGAIHDRDLPKVRLGDVVWLKGPRGSVTVHNCRMVHGSMPNESSRSRPLLLHTYAAADAITLFPGIVDNIALSNSVIRGEAGPLGRVRPAALPDPAGLVEGLHLHLRSSAGGGEGGLRPFGRAARPYRFRLLRAVAASARGSGPTHRLPGRGAAGLSPDSPGLSASPLPWGTAPSRTSRNRAIAGHLNGSVLGFPRVSRKVPKLLTPSSFGFA